jgi:hypothetical protein
MIDLIHLQRLRQQRLRYEAEQRQFSPRPAMRAVVTSALQSDGRRALLRVVSAALFGAAVDGTAMRNLLRRARR